MSNRKSNTKTSHPPYQEMICQAVMTLKERTGSSVPAISKFISANYKGVVDTKVKTELKRMVSKGQLTKNKNSFKLSAGMKDAINKLQKGDNSASKTVKNTPKKPPAKAPPVKKPPVKKAPVKKAPVKKAPVKKTPVKKSPAKSRSRTPSRPSTPKAVTRSSPKKPLASAPPIVKRNQPKVKPAPRKIAPPKKAPVKKPPVKAPPAKTAPKAPPKKAPLKKGSGKMSTPVRKGTISTAISRKSKPITRRNTR